MQHEGASTRFILSGLTRAIELLFSIRQRDPLAMLLYINVTTDDLGNFEIAETVVQKF